MAEKAYGPVRHYYRRRTERHLACTPFTAVAHGLVGFPGVWGINHSTPSLLEQEIHTLPTIRS